MSAHIAIRCDECGNVVTDVSWSEFALFRRDLSKNGWTTEYGGDLCPFCAARRKAKEQAEAATE